MQKHIPAACVSVIAIVLSLVHMFVPEERARVDSTTLILLVAASIPWLFPFLDYVKGPGGWEFKFRELEQKVEEQQGLINKLVETSMSASAFNHLVGITILNEYKYWENDKVGELFKREFYYLKDRGFIGPETLEFYKELNGTNIAEKAKPTDIGLIYIKLRKDDIPKEWLDLRDPDKRKNLKIEVALALGLKLGDDGRAAPAV